MNTLRLSDYKDKLIHFIGIGGSSMSGLAELLTGAGLYRCAATTAASSHSTDKLIREGHSEVRDRPSDAKNVHGAGLDGLYRRLLRRTTLNAWNAERLGIPQMERCRAAGADVPRTLSAFAVAVSRHARQNHYQPRCSSQPCCWMQGAIPTIHIGGELDLIGGSVPGAATAAIPSSPRPANSTASFLHAAPHGGAWCSTSTRIIWTSIRDHSTTSRRPSPKFLALIVPGGMARAHGGDDASRPPRSVKQRISRAGALTYGLGEHDMRCTRRTMIYAR